ncbi:MAG: YbhB/YbcL family Raf kinase inhibitor-like protein [Phycisphaera sp.]|nr:YbhB/YbcL family Raf kinase inhibitor-like protein [Phycisphaera sp.]
MSMTITTTAFKPGEPIPVKHTGDGADRSPALSWRNLPDGTKSLALIVDDPDAPTDEPWVHWVMWNIPAHATGAPEGVPRNPKLVEPAGAVQGSNSWPSDNLGYRGPAPPKGHGTHHYHFKLYALDVASVDLAPGATKAQLLAAIKGHELGTAALIGTYERK